MLETLTSALIAAVVALVVSVATSRLERRKLESEEKRHASELKRRLTEKMLDLRLKAYPIAFRITDKLRGDLLFDKETPITPAALHAVRDELQEWHRTNAGFLLTTKPRNSLGAYRELCDALTVHPADSGYSQKQLTDIWEAKNKLRGALKSDLHLLYEED